MQTFLYVKDIGIIKWKQLRYYNENNFIIGNSTLCLYKPQY